jgi:hypothetical protein
MKIGRIKIEEVGETYGVISPDGKRIITKLDFQEQTGVPIPQTIKEFIVRGWIDEVNKYISDIKFSNEINHRDLLIIMIMQETQDLHLQMNLLFLSNPERP